VEEATRATGDQILITAATHDRLTLPFGGFSERHGLTLKGKREGVRVFAPLLDGAGTAGASRHASTA
jgi:adenylate cyclase